MAIDRMCRARLVRPRSLHCAIDLAFILREVAIWHSPGLRATKNSKHHDRLLLSPDWGHSETVTSEGHPLVTCPFNIGLKPAQILFRGTAAFHGKMLICAKNIRKSRTPQGSGLPGCCGAGGDCGLLTRNQHDPERRQGSGTSAGSSAPGGTLI